MSGKDPFDFEDGEAERTVIRSTPLGARPAPDEGDRTMISPAVRSGAGAPVDETERTQIGPANTAGRSSGPFAPQSVSTAPIDTVGPNPLIAAGAPLIALANWLRAMTHHDDLPHLRQQVIEELRNFQTAARAKAATEEELRYGHYALCALLDEVVLSTPWGSKSSWGKQSLVATFHNEVVSGDRMFEVAEALESRPNRSPNLLELIYLCLSFGFEGRMRLDRQGASRLFQLRERIHTAIRNVRGPFERALSPLWRGESAGYQPITRQVPLWVYAAALAALALLVYAGFLFALSAMGSRALRPLTALYSAGPSRLNRTAPAPASDTRLYQTVLGILKPDIDAGRVGVVDQPDSVLVRLKDKGLFASGSAELDPAYGETMRRVAQAMALTVGDVPVTGNTDDKPVRTLQFASNQALSDARAAAVVAKLKENGAPNERLKPIGLGESQPVADNATEDGRRQNRRVEVAIPKTYASPQPAG